MKTHSNATGTPGLAAVCLTCCFLTSIAPPATAADKFGFVRLIDTVVQGQGKLVLLIDGEAMNPDGYNPGDVTGGIGLKPGAHEITIRRPGLSEGVTRLSITAEQTINLIPFAEPVPATAAQPAHWAMRILRLRQMQPLTKRSATVVSVSQSPEEALDIGAPNGTWTTVAVKRLAIARTPILYPEGYVPLRCQSGKLSSIPVGEPGNYLVVLYDDAAGNLHALSFQDYKYCGAD